MMVDRRLWFRHQCIVCKLLFVSERDLLLHEATHDKPDFVCALCNEVFKTEEDYQYHTSVGCEPTIRAQVCKVCGAVFKQMRDLYDHHSALHLSKQKFQCKVCSATFSWPENLEKHELLHQTNSSMCKTCGAIFASMASLKVHLWKAHSVNIRDQDRHMVEMPVACRSNSQICKSAGTSAQLCLGCQTSAPEELTARQDEDKPYKCSLCNWSFKYDFSYTLHMKMHEEKQRLNRTPPHVTADAENGKEVQLPVLNPTSSLPNTFPLQNDRNESSAHAKKTIYIRRADIVYNFSLSKPPVVLGKSLEKPASVLSQEQTVEEKRQISGVRNDIAAELCNKRLPAHKSEKVQNTASSTNTFTCKTCMVTFQYDFSYVAHMKYHEKVKQLDCENYEAENNPKSRREDFQLAFIPNHQLSASEILINSNGAIVNPDGSVLIKVNEVVPQNLVESLALKMYNFSDGKISASCPISESDQSTMKYILIQQSKGLPITEGSNTLDSGGIIEEVINIDSQEDTSSVLEVSYLPEELEGCLSDDFSKVSNDVSQVIVVENHDSAEYLLSSELQLTSGHLELDRIEVDSGTAVNERIETGTADDVETIHEECYRELAREKPVSATEKVYAFNTELNICTNDKPHICSVCRAEFRFKRSLQAHLRKHLGDPTREISNLQMLKMDRAVRTPT